MTQENYFTGRGNISARVIADSLNSNGIRMMTYELEYPRFIHSEFMTHRMLSKNSASSRAIPVAKMHEHIQQVPQAPIHWGKNQSGMQAKEELEGVHLEAAKELWDEARDAAIKFAQTMNFHGLHKQAANRITEPYMQMKVVCSGTEWTNFFWLRNHEDAQPEIQELAKLMWQGFRKSLPQILKPGEWHLPYINTEIVNDVAVYTDQDGNELTLEDARIISASCCAQVSYRKSDDSLEKARQIFDRLVKSEPVHASPVEHQATPMQMLKNNWEPGVTHQTRNGDMWSGNLRGWVQYRQLIPNHSRMEINQ